jgi:hypothetical protein
MTSHTLTATDLTVNKCGFTFDPNTQLFSTSFLTSRLHVANAPQFDYRLNNIILLEQDDVVNGMVIYGISSRTELRHKFGLCDSLPKDKIISGIEKWMTEFENLCVIVYDHSIIPSIYYNDLQIISLVYNTMMEKSLSKEKDGIDYSTCINTHIPFIPYVNKPVNYNSLFWRLSIPELSET